MVEFEPYKKAFFDWCDDFDYRMTSKYHIAKKGMLFFFSRLKFIFLFCSPPPQIQYNFFSLHNAHSLWRTDSLSHQLSSCPIILIDIINH